MLSAITLQKVNDLNEIWNSVSQMWGWPWQILGTIHAVETVCEGSFFHKMHKLLTKFPRLVTSGRHNSAMITNAENSWPNVTLMGCLVSTFIVRINSKSFPWAVRCAHQRDLPKFLAASIVRHCPIVRCNAGAAQSHRYGSGASL